MPRLPPLPGSVPLEVISSQHHADSSVGHIAIIAPFLESKVFFWLAMKRGKGGGKGRAKANRHARGTRFQDDDEIEKRNAEGSSDSEERNEEEKSGDEESSEESSEDEGEGERKPKGPTTLIETANLNRGGPKKENLKVTDASATAKPELSRRERWGLLTFRLKKVLCL